MRTAKHPERAERLDVFLKKLKIKNVELAKRLGLKRPTYVSQLLNKHTTITADAANRIVSAYPELNIFWLLHGTGEMLIEKSAQPSSVVGEPEAPYSADPFEALKRIIQDHEERIRALEKGRE